MLQRKKRVGFTLVELMVVVLIIAVLVSLISSAAFMALGKIPEVQTSTDIAQMGAALGAFMSDYRLTNPPPSVLVLNETTPTDPLVVGSTSAAFLTKVFGRNLGPTDWNGDGAISGQWVLTGEQSLIFYITGIPNTQTTAAQLAAGQVPTYQGLGFASNQMKPSFGSMTGEKPGKRHGPYFNLPSSYLNKSGLWDRGLAPQASNTRAAQFLVYYDAWANKSGAVPLAYFSSSGFSNQYGTVVTITDPYNRPIMTVPVTLIGAAPYFTATNQYVNPNSYQIISAGKDHQFGSGNLNTASSEAPGGHDDQANFSIK